MSDCTSSTATGGASPHPDWDAFCILQEQTQNTGRGWSHDCIDHALDRLLANPHRASSGRKLADSVYRNARKSLRRRTHAVSLTDVGDIEANPNDPLVDDEITQTAMRGATHIRNTLDSLPVRLRNALVAKSDGSASDEAGSQLNVKPRQFRNLVREVRKHLLDVAGTVEALESLHQGFLMVPHPTAFACHLALTGWEGRPQ